MATAAPAAAACFDFSAKGQAPRASTTSDPLGTAAIGEHPSSGEASTGASCPLLLLLLLLLPGTLVGLLSPVAPSNSSGEKSRGPKIACAVCHKEVGGDEDDAGGSDGSGAAA